MSIATQTFTPVAGTFTVNAATTPKITNFSILVANTEYSVALQAGLKSISIRNRGSATTKYAFISGQSSTNYMTIPVGCTLLLSGLDFTGKTIYFNCSVVSTLEIVELY